MGMSLSPGVVTKEIDLTQIVPAVATTDAAIAGVFSWGPIDDRELVSSEGELVLRFGKPTSDNYETFYSASNYLAYSNRLYVTRAGDANTKNAVGGNGSINAALIKNKNDYESKADALPANSSFIAKHAGTLGNSLKVAVCDSAAAYSSLLSAPASTTLSVSFNTSSNVAVFSVTGANAAAANTAAGSLADQINIGDILVSGNSTIGTQYVKVSAVGSPTAANTVATFNVNLESTFNLAANVQLTEVRRFWEYFGAVDGAPTTSYYTSQRGGSGDELHIVVVDEDGKFSGTPGTLLEVFDRVSRATDALGEAGGSIYWKDKINLSSLYVWAGAALPGATSGLAATMSPLTTHPKDYSLNGGVDTVSESAIVLADLARAYDQYKSSEAVDVSIIIVGKSVGGVHGEGLANYIIDNICEYRQDCVAVLSPQLNDVVNNPYQEAESIVEFRNAIHSSSYAFIDSGYKYQYDRYNDKYRWIPLNGDIAGTFARTDETRDPWWSPAGYSRGGIKNITKLAYNPDKADRDILYKSDINPVVSFPGSSTILYGDKTALGRPSAFDRINVRRLFIVLRKAIAIAAKTTLFEFNDSFTRAQFRNMVQPYLRDIQGRRGIYAFKVVCDETNNTGQVIDSNEFIGDIYIQPARSISFITLNFVATRTNVDFAEVIGKF